MNIERTAQNEASIERLWEDFLLAGTVNEILLGEVADHLYLEDVPRPLRQAHHGKGKDPLETYAAETGLSDSVAGAVEAMEDDPHGTQPYSELLRRYDPERLAGLLLEKAGRHIRRYPPEAVTGNPYFQRIHPARAASGPFRLGEADYFPFEFWQAYHFYDPSDPFGYGDAGFFDGPVRFPALFEKKRVWMSIVMSEIASMEEGIRAARGRVITYGLGLGYYAFMAAEKPEVRHVTVVEIDPHVVRLFTEQILPQFPHAEKIEICEADAFEWIRTQRDGDYDYGYADFWAGTDDGFLLYMDFLPLTARFQKTRFGFWIESCFFDYYLRPMLMKWLMKEGLGRTVHLPRNEKKVHALQDEFFHFLEQKEGTARTPAGIVRLLTPQALAGLALSFSLKKR